MPRLFPTLAPLLPILPALACGPSSAAPRSGVAAYPSDGPVQADGPASAGRPAGADPAGQGRLREGADTIRAIADEALLRGRSWEMLEELVRVAPKRLAGSAGAARAVEWGVEAMRAAGLDEVRKEPCPVPHWERGEMAELEIVAPDGIAGERLSILALGGSVGTPAAGLEGGVIAVRSFEELRERAEQARGRFVLFDRPMDPATLDPFAAYGAAVDQRSSGASEAARAGGLAALVRSMTTARDDRPHTGAMRYGDESHRVPAVAVSTLGAERLARLAREHAGLRLRLRLDCRDHGEVESHNVVGELLGRERPQEIVLLGAHLDAWDVGQGAHDDGAGCVQVIEAVRILNELGRRPRRTLRVVLFMNEENGLRGALTYAATHADELGRHVLALESDRGGFTPRGFTTDADGEALARLERAVSSLVPLGAGELRRGGGGADIGVLAPAGVPLVGYLPDPQRYFDLHHSENDVLEAVHPRELALGAAAIAGLAWQFAEDD